MILSPIPLLFTPEYLKFFLLAKPILILNISRRGFKDPDNECHWSIIYCEKNKRRLVYLNENIPGQNNALEIPFGEIGRIKTRKILEKRIAKFAKLWGTTVEDLIDRIMENRPPAW